MPTYEQVPVELVAVGDVLSTEGGEVRVTGRVRVRAVDAVLTVDAAAFALTLDLVAVMLDTADGPKALTLPAGAVVTRRAGPPAPAPDVRRVEFAAVRKVP